MSEGKPSWDEAVGMLEQRIAEQARTIDDYRNEVTRLMAERDQEAAGSAAAHERIAELVSEVNELRELLGRYERITTAWTRGMYCAWIDCQRGDPKAAAMTLSEGLDGYDGTPWNGTETGTEWWERTKAEEGLADEPAVHEQLADDHYVIPRGDIDHATRISREARLEREGRVPAVVTSGTEHLAKLISGLAIPDEDDAA